MITPIYNCHVSNNSPSYIIRNRSIAWHESETNSTVVTFKGSMYIYQDSQWSVDSHKGLVLVNPPQEVIDLVNTKQLPKMLELDYRLARPNKSGNHIGGNYFYRWNRQPKWGLNHQPISSNCEFKLG